LTFETLYNTYKDLVFNLALQYTQNYEDAQEITQDVFVSVHLSMGKFNYEAKLSTWMYRITINKSLDFIKSKKRNKRFGLFTSLFFDNTNEPKHEISEFNHPGVQLEQKEALQRIFSVLNTLPENQKTALILFKIEKQSLQEIAEIMKLQPKAVESLIFRAKENLAKKLNQTNDL
jgi:RNA polymerase sigma factor (sigma-70 family)